MSGEGHGLAPLDARRKKLTLLALLLGAWGALLLVRPDLTVGNKPTSPVRPSRPEAAQRRGGPAEAEIPRFRQDLLDLPLPSYRKERQNPFGEPPPPPPPPPPRPTVLLAPTPAPVAVPPLPTPDPFYEEVKQYRFLGTGRDEDGARAFLAGGPDLLIVKPLDTLGTRYVVKDIQEEVLVLRSTEGEKELTLSLSGAAGGSSRTPPRP